MTEEPEDTSVAVPDDESPPKTPNVLEQARAWATHRVGLPLWILVLILILCIGLGATVGADSELKTAQDRISTLEELREEETANYEETLNELRDQYAKLATTTTRPPTTTVPATTAPPPPPPAPKRWVRVTELSGSTDKRGDVFELQGGEARMIYSSGDGVFGVYIVDEGDSLDESGGFTEVDCYDPCSDSTKLANGPGRYYLDVKASGSWKVVIEEMR